MDNAYYLFILICDWMNDVRIDDFSVSRSSAARCSLPTAWAILAHLHDFGSPTATMY
jgi:hypothetical protein